MLRPGMIDAAVERARWGPFERGDLAERAAFLFRGITQEHPFVDGNKRTGFELMDLFLGRNGAVLFVSDDEVVELALSVARGRRTIREIAAWIRENMENR